MNSGLVAGVSSTLMIAWARLICLSWFDHHHLRNISRFHPWEQLYLSLVAFSSHPDLQATFVHYLRVETQAHPDGIAVCALRRLLLPTYLQCCNRRIIIGFCCLHFVFHNVLLTRSQPHWFLHFRQYHLLLWRRKWVSADAFFLLKIEPSHSFAIAEGILDFDSFE